MDEHDRKATEMVERARHRSRHKHCVAIAEDVIAADVAALVRATAHARDAEVERLREERDAARKALAGEWLSTAEAVLVRTLLHGEESAK